MHLKIINEKRIHKFERQQGVVHWKAWREEMEGARM